MLTNTLEHLVCPGCEADALKLKAPYDTGRAHEDLLEGLVVCAACQAGYPILAGVLIAVRDVGAYLIDHVKGISRQVDDSSIPKEYRGEFKAARKELSEEHIEEDLEAERVTSLYLMNHYLAASDVSSPDPVIAELVKRHWDHGPFERLGELLASTGTRHRLVELGCNVGGLARALSAQLDAYLGVDSSFAAIAMARHLTLGAPYRGRIQVPGDLLQGAVSRDPALKRPAEPLPQTDFIVCDLDAPPLKEGSWSATAALNVIDMLPEPEALPRLQYALLTKGGVAVQSCPYVWHPEVAAKLRSRLPKDVKDSAAAAEWLYRSEGFTIGASHAHVPWLFYKHFRQLELYSVHVFLAQKS